MNILDKVFDSHPRFGRKPENTAWCQCSKCRGWFHIGPSIFEHKTICVHCPHCHHEFKTGEAARIVVPYNSKQYNGE